MRALNGDTSRMSPEVTEAAIREFLECIRERLDKAGAIAKAAEACVEAGDAGQAVSIVLDIEQPIYEVTTFLNAASLIKRCSGS